MGSDFSVHTSNGLSSMFLVPDRYNYWYICFVGQLRLVLILWRTIPILNLFISDVISLLPDFTRYPILQNLPNNLFFTLHFFYCFVFQIISSRHFCGWPGSALVGVHRTLNHSDLVFIVTLLYPITPTEIVEMYLALVDLAKISCTYPHGPRLACDLYKTWWISQDNSRKV